CATVCVPRAVVGVAGLEDPDGHAGEIAGVRPRLIGVPRAVALGPMAVVPTGLRRSGCSEDGNGGQRGGEQNLGHGTISWLVNANGPILCQFPLRTGLAPDF